MHIDTKNHNEIHHDPHYILCANEKKEQAEIGGMVGLANHFISLFYKLPFVLTICYARYAGMLLFEYLLSLKAPDCRLLGV